MRFISLLSVLLCSSFLLPAANELTPQEKKDGWRLLFNGSDLQGWRNFKKTTAPQQGWVVENGLLIHHAKAGGGDIITEKTFGDFEFSFEWRIASGGNSGVKYFITEQRGSPVGHEYQLLDDSSHADAKVGDHRKTASFYDVIPANERPTVPVGEFNTSRIKVQGNLVQHWLNGVKVLEYELESAAVREAIAKSKFKTTPGFGSKMKGHILLQDHGDEVAFRNVKIREL